jgi:putative heme-binding domain-containing protein
MNQKKHFKGILSFVALVIAVSIAFDTNRNEPFQLSSDPKVANLKLPEGFRADRLYGPSENGEGSWVSMTFDNKGRIIASDQYGALYRLTVPLIGDTVTKTVVEKLQIPDDAGSLKDTSRSKVNMGYAHGLLWAFNSLYVVINHRSNKDFAKGSGVYRLEDANGDDQFEKISLLRELNGEGEHGPHSIVLSPDKKSLYVIAGNFTKIPKMDSYRNFPTGQIDNLFPLIKDPRGHDNTVHAEGGWIAHIDPEGKKWELVSSGFRNPFDLAFNDAGDMFTYDSDMEWDFGTPWYRPTRICHVTGGSEFGWRPGTDKWSPNYADNLPPMLNIGQGSPTNLVYGADAKFPKKYRNAFFAFDWSFGIIYAIYPEVAGASYKARGEEFVSGSPLPLTDGVIGPDGALYFATGGRRLESDLYRVYYAGKESKDEKPAPTILTEPNKVRRKLEALHSPQAGAVNIAWPYLKDNDRFVRYAARIAVENQPVAEWQEKTLNEKDPVILAQAAIALARKGNPGVKGQLLKALSAVRFAGLTETQQHDHLRAIELTFSRFGAPDAAEKTMIANSLNASYPAKTNDLNRELSKLLVYVDAPKAVEKTMALLADAKDDPAAQNSLSQSADLILRNPQYGIDIAGMLTKMPPLQQTWYANVLSQAKTGWTPELRKTYFEWYYKAFSYQGGRSFVGFIDKARKNALANAPQDQVAYYSKISGDELVALSGTNLALGAVRPKGPGRNWKLDDAAAVIDSGLANRDFEKGKAMFAATLCSSCHQVQGTGGVSGPDLTQLGNRFTYRDMLESIIAPSKTISDQYGSTVFYLKDGGSILGRLVRQDNTKYYIAQNPFAPETVREVLKKNVVRTRVSEISPMLPGMINGMNGEELKDLIAYLKSGGNKNHPIYTSAK